MFELLNYGKVKSDVIDLIKSSHDWESTEGFIADGLISPFDYSTSVPKIAVCLAESYGYDKCRMTDIEEQPSKDVLGIASPKAMTSKKIPTLLWMLYASMERKELIPWEDIPWLFQSNLENISALQNVLKKVAWINVKKASKPYDGTSKEPTRQNYDEIYRHAMKNKEILSRQLTSIEPDILIVCSDPVMHALSDMKLLGDEIVRTKKGEMQISKKGQQVLFVSHPSYFKDWGYRGIYKTCRIIFETWKTKA